MGGDVGRSVRLASRTQGREIRDDWAIGGWLVRRRNWRGSWGGWERGRGAVVAALGSGGGGTRAAAAAGPTAVEIAGPGQGEVAASAAARIGATVEAVVGLLP